MTRGARPDPADLTFFANLFAGVAEEMGVALARTAYSANIKERRDLSCAVFDGKGSLAAQAAHIPVHLGAMPLSVTHALLACGPLRAGDAVILNDPYAGGTHLPDITLVTAVFPPRAGKRRASTKPLAYLASRAHHADVGGMAPGSMPLAREIYQEGIRIPPVRLLEQGVENEAVLRILAANVRTPRERAGDLRAQLAAHATGAERLMEAAARYGPAALSRHMESLARYGEALMRSVISGIPDGTYRFEDVLEDDGISAGPVPIRAAVAVRGDEAMVDFAGTGPACAGSLNAVEAVTRSAVYYCFLCLLITANPLSAPSLPLNAGCFAPIRVRAPSGSLLNAEAPCAVAGGNVETSQRVVDVVLGALSRALPGVIPAASQGTMNNVALGGRDPFRLRGFAYYETLGGGMGGRPSSPGLDAVHVHMTNTLNTPVEALEFAYPLRVERYEIAQGTGGAGRHRGGNGLRRDLRVLCPAQGTVLSERRVFAPYGLAGGRPGARGENALVRKGRRRRLPGKAQIDLEAGDVLSIRTPGGGGWGK